MGKRLVDVLDEQEKQTFLTTTIIPRIDKLLNYIRVAELDASGQRDRDYEYIKELKQRIVRGKHPLKKNDLELCNELYRKYKYGY
jgi:hypothetical protein